MFHQPHTRLAAWSTPSHQVPIWDFLNLDECFSSRLCLSLEARRALDPLELVTDPFEPACGG